MTPRVFFVATVCLLLSLFATPSQAQPAFAIDYTIVSGATAGCIDACECATTANPPDDVILDVRVTNAGNLPSVNTRITASLIAAGTFRLLQGPPFQCRDVSPTLFTCQDVMNAFPPGASLNVRIAYTPGLVSLRRGHFVSGLLLQAGGMVAGDFRTEYLSSRCFTFLTPTCTPIVSVQGTVQSGLPYSVTWTETAGGTAYEIQEAKNPDFSDAATFTADGPGQSFQHAVTETTTYFYRVRPTSCSAGAPQFSDIGRIVILAPPPPDSTSFDLVAPLDRPTTIRQDVLVRDLPPNGTFTARSDQPYITVTPSSGSVSPSGVASFRIDAMTDGLAPGANASSIIVSATPAGAAKRGFADGATSATIPVNVNLVTPVSPFKRLLPADNTLIIPVVTHVNGANAPFRSDVRLLNLSPGSVNYTVTFTPTRTAGNGPASKATRVPASSGQTVALNDVVKTFFGIGATNAPSDFGFGSLEIRPDTATDLHFGSSRTYAQIPAGTLGQFVPAIPYSAFLKSASGTAATLNLQQVAQSSRFRTNLGLIEGSAAAARGNIRVFNDAGQLLASVPYELQPGEHQQLNSFIAANAGVANLEDGRIEITLESSTGAIAAYASVLDAITTDPLAVTGVDASKIKATRYIVPGIADLNNGAANFHSDLRIFNGGTAPSIATLTYFAQNAAPGIELPPITISPGEVRSFDNILPATFNIRNSGGSILITTPSDSSLVATARTYTNAEAGGTYGQFIPGVTPANGIDIDGRALQVFQLEQSPQFRTNLGLVELTGNPVRVRVTLTPPDSKVSSSIDVDLAPNEFRQFGSIISSMMPGDSVYNARMSVDVVGGTGRITAYASVIDNRTQDPTYVPAQ